MILGLGLGPLAQPQHFDPEGGRGVRSRASHRLADLRPPEQRILCCPHLVAHPQQARVVGASLEHLRAGFAAQHRSHRLGSHWDVLLGQLGLQGQRRSGNQNSLGRFHRPDQRWDQVSQRFSGAGAGLDQQVGAVGETLQDLVAHHLLARTRAAVDRRNGGGQDIGGLARLVSHDLVRCPAAVLRRLGHMVPAGRRDRGALWPSPACRRPGAPGAASRPRDGPGRRGRPGSRAPVR